MSQKPQYLDGISDFYDLDESETWLEEKSEGMLWRKELLEQALTNVKNVQNKPFTFDQAAKESALVYLANHRQFARVLSEEPLKLKLLDGTLIDSQTQVTTALKKEPKNQPAKEKTKNSKEKPLTIEPLAAKKPIKKDVVNSEKAATTKIKAPVTAAPTKAVQELAIKQKLPPTKKASAINLTPAKIEAPKAKAEIATNLIKRLVDKDTEYFIPKDAITDPVMDPNGYIRQYFNDMSNKELSAATGYSEHTIRRKLNEWGLKRKV